MKFERNGKTYELLEEGGEADVQYQHSDHYDRYNVFWTYSCSGLHIGEPFLIAVKNPHYEADGDEHGIYYHITNDGRFWDDDLKARVDDEVDDWYSDAINEAVSYDYNEE